MAWLRVLIGLLAVLVLTEIAVLANSIWPPADQVPFRAGYGYEPPSAALLDYIRSSEFQVVQTGNADRTALESGKIDVMLSAQSGLDLAGAPVDWVTVVYDPQLPHSVYGAHRVEELINGYSGPRKAHALLSPSSDVPFSFHLFFDVLLPLLTLLAVAAGVVAGRRRRPIRTGVMFAAALFVLLLIVLPGTDFQGPESTSSNVGFLSPLAIGIQILAAWAFAATLAPALQDGGNRWLARTPAAAAALFAVLFSASLWDPTPSAWVITATPLLITGTGLLGCAAVAIVSVRRRQTLGVKA